MQNHNFILIFEDYSYLFLTRSATTNILNNTNIFLPWTDSVYDTSSTFTTAATSSYWSSSTNSQRITNTSGRAKLWYAMFSIRISAGGSGTSVRVAQIQNSTGTIYGNSVVYVGSTLVSRLTGSAIILVPPNDYIQLRVYQNSGSTLDIIGDATNFALKPYIIVYDLPWF